MYPRYTYIDTYIDILHMYMYIFHISPNIQIIWDHTNYNTYIYTYIHTHYIYILTHILDIYI